MPSVEQLKQRLAKTLKTRQLGAALGALSALAQKEPRDASWPRRAARLLHATRNPRAELQALRRALELQIDQGLVLDAITSCKAVLEIVPDDEQTLEYLDLLYLHGAPDVSSSREAETGETGSEVADAPLDSLLLTEVVPGAKSVQLADAQPGRVSEIPLDVSSSPESDEVVDLRLDQWSSAEAMRDLAAAQAMSLPGTGRGARAGGRSRHDRERGSSLRSELANVPLFGDLDPASLQTLILNVRVVNLDAG